MVNSCGIVGCNNNQWNCTYGFFKLPSVNKTSQEEEHLTRERRKRWLAAIRRKNLTTAQLSEKNSSLKVCGKHFVNGKPSKLFETTSTDWAPSMFLGQEVKTLGDDRYVRAKNRREQKSLLLGVEKTTASTTPLRLSTLPPPRASPNTLSLTASPTSTKTAEVDELHKIIDSKNIQISKLMAENQKLKEQLSSYRFDISFFKDNEDNVVYYTGLSSFDILMALYDFVKYDIKTIISLSKFEQLSLCLMTRRH